MYSRYNPVFTAILYAVYTTEMTPRPLLERAHDYRSPSNARTPVLGDPWALRARLPLEICRSLSHSAIFKRWVRQSRCLLTTVLHLEYLQKGPRRTVSELKGLNYEETRSEFDISPS